MWPLDCQTGQPDSLRQRVAGRARLGGPSPRFPTPPTSPPGRPTTPAMRGSFSSSTTCKGWVTQDGQTPQPGNPLNRGASPSRGGQVACQPHGTTTAPCGSPITFWGPDSGCKGNVAPCPERHPPNTNVSSKTRQPATATAPARETRHQLQDTVLPPHQERWTNDVTAR